MEIAALSALIAGPAEVSQPRVPAATNALATERFNAIMNGPDSAGVTGVQAMLQTSTPLVTLEPAASLGGQILSGLRGVGDDMATKWQNIATGLNGVGVQPTVGDMLRMQSEMLQLSLMYEVVGKGVARSTQNIDTVVRMS